MGVVGEYIDFGRRMKEYGVETHAVSCLAQKSLCLRLKIAGYPMVRMYGPGEVDLEGHDLALAELHPLRVLEQFKIPVDENDKRKLNLTWAVSSQSSASHHTSAWKERLSRLSPWRWLASSSPRQKPTYRRTSQEIESDAHKSLDLTLRSSVFQGQDEPLAEETKATLYDFLTLLDGVLPPTWNTLHGLVHDIVSNFLFVSKSEDYLASYLDRTPPSSSWTTFCSHGSPTAGYSCGLWTLFHAATVGAVEFNSMSMQRNRMGTELVARQIRNFVQAFFSCAECSSHFVSSFDACEYDRCHLLSTHGNGTVSQADWQQLPLWLSKVHNSVNVRRAAAITSGKRLLSREEQRYQPLPRPWPARADCPPCWISGPVSQQDQWAEDVVYQFLKLEYFTGYPNATSNSPSQHDTTLTFQEDPSDVSLYHFLISCILVGVVFFLWHSLQFGFHRLTRKLKV
jgi:thiol oxidase